MTKARTADVVVVGGGILGAATAFHASRLGLRVTVVADHHEPGATARSAGIVRGYHPDPVLAGLARAGMRAFEAWEDEIRAPSPLRRTGVVYRAPADAPASSEGIRAAGAELIDASSVLPDTGMPGPVVYEPLGGWADPLACVTQLLRGVRRRGGTVLNGRVAEVATHHGRVSGVTTTEGTITTPVVVVAVGCGHALGGLLPGAETLVSRHHLPWLEVEIDRSPGCPVYVDDDKRGLVARASADGRVVLGTPSYAADRPSMEKRGCRGLAIERLTRAWGRPVLRTTRVIDGYDGYTADGRPVLDQWPTAEGLWALVGGSGGAFKAAPALGAALAHWIAGDGPSALIQPFAAARLTAAAD